jgi:hypothetical protein
MADKTINDFGVISTSGTDHILAQTAGNVTGKQPISQLETWLDYYRKTAYVSLSTGVPDAGKPIVLDGSGKIHSSMLGITDLSTVLSTGNTTGGTDIEVSSGDEIVCEVGTDLNVSVPTAGAGNPGTHLRLSAGSGGTGTTIGGNILMSPGAGSGGGADGVVRVLGDGDVTGDLNVSGKLTVVGLIDPVGLVLEEAAAPSTGATEGAIFVDTADSKLKFRAKNDAVVEEIVVGVGGATSTAMARVDPTSSDAVDDNDLTTAMVTVQGGVDAVVNAGGGTVYVLPGTYTETVYIRKTEKVSIVGVDDGGFQYGSGSVQIRGVAGKPSIVVSEATQASLDALFALGAPNYDTNYVATLVSDSGAGIPQEVRLENLYLWPTDGTEYSLVVAGVDSASTMLDNEGLTVKNCQVLRGHYTRLTNYIAFEQCVLGTGGGGIKPWLFNVGRCDYHMTTFTNSVEVTYDTGENEPTEGNEGHHFTYCKRTSISGFGLSTNGTGWVNTALACQFANVIARDTSRISLYNCDISSVSSAEVGAKIDARGCTFANDIDFNGGSLLCTFEDCHVNSLTNVSSSRLALVMMDGEFDLQTEKVTPVSADLLLVEDSAAGYVKKKVQVGNLPGGGGAATSWGRYVMQGSVKYGLFVPFGTTVPFARYFGASQVKGAPYVTSFAVPTTDAGLTIGASGGGRYLLMASGTCGWSGTAGNLDVFFTVNGSDTGRHRLCRFGSNASEDFLAITDFADLVPGDDVRLEFYNRSASVSGSVNGSFGIVIERME